MGDRLARLRDRDEPLGRVHRSRRSDDRRRIERPGRRITPGAVPARRNDHLAVPRTHLRADGGDDRLGALGRDDRVHVHGARPPRHAPARHVRGHTRPRARIQCRDPRRGSAFRTGRSLARERTGRDRAPPRRGGRVRGTRDRVRGLPAPLDREGSPDGVHRPGGRAPRVGCVLPDHDPARLDADPVVHLAGDVRHPRHARRAPRRRGPRRGVAEPLAGAARGRISIPLGMRVFLWAERHAKRTGRLKRSG